jgi:hypothetical protein
MLRIGPQRASGRFTLIEHLKRLMQIDIEHACCLLN